MMRDINLRWFAALAMVVYCAAEASVVAREPVAERVVRLDESSAFAVRMHTSEISSLWAREVMRQALLMAAREELGLRTVDAALGELVSPTDPAVFEITCQPKEQLDLLQGARGERTSIWQESVDSQPLEVWPYHRQWVEQMEALSRQEFVIAWERAGFARHAKPSPENSAASLDAVLTARIDHDLAFDSQFLALRSLHQATIVDGETRARLGGLVRTYSHLGLLTEYYWHPMSFALKARALLYAQRWVVRDPRSPAAWWHRAYAFALAGLHGAALEELKSADTIAQSLPSKPVSPAWVPLLEAFCRYDFARLEELRQEEELKPLATLLCFLAHEQEGSRNATLNFGLQALSDLPGCYRIHDTLCDFSGVRAGHITSQAGSLQLAGTLLPRLYAVRELPQPVVKALAEARQQGAIAGDGQELDPAAETAARRAVVDALLQPAPAAVSDGAAMKETVVTEPDWPMLGQMIEETSFLQVFRRLYFVRTQLGIPVDELMEANQLLVEKHRYAPFLEAFRGLSAVAFVKAVEGLPQGNIHAVQGRLWQPWVAVVRSQFASLADRHTESLPNEIGLAARAQKDGFYTPPIPFLLVSPHSPYAKATALRDAKTEALSHEEEWAKDAERSPFLAATFARVSNARGKPSDAERFYKLAISLDPAMESYQALAALYKQQGKEQEWLAVLEEFLKQPDFGLYHARTRVDISQYYRSRREWDKALPYANAAAETFAQWALLEAAEVNEANQNWDDAETYLLSASERYGANPERWYHWCRRTGRGNSSGAKQQLVPDELEEKVPQGMKYEPAMILQLEGKTAIALETYDKLFQRYVNPWIGLHAALLAEERGQPERRDAILKRIVKDSHRFRWKPNPRGYRVELIHLASQFVDDLSRGGKCEFDFKALDIFRSTASEDDICAFNYFLGRYLALHGQEKQAIEYWKQGMGCSQLTLPCRTLCGYELSKRKVDPRTWKALLFAKPAAE